MAGLEIWPDCNGGWRVARQYQGLQYIASLMKATIKRVSSQQEKSVSASSGFLAMGAGNKGGRGSEVNRFCAAGMFMK